MKKFFKDNENKICFILFIVTMLTAVSPLISRYCINGHDLEYHLLRIESLKEGILIGKPFLKVNTLFFGGAGYASSMFYSDLFLYFPAILRVLGFSIAASYHTFVGLIFILCYGTGFYAAYRMSGSKYAGTLAAILLTLCPYHMDDMLVRGACGEYMAFIFVPLVIYGVYNVIFEQMDRPYVFGIGFGGLILTHPATLFFNLCFTVLAFIVFIKKIFADKKIIIKLALTTLVTLLATAFQWLPMLEQMMSTGFYVSADSIDMLDAAVGFSEIFTEGFPAVGIILLICLIPRIFLTREEEPILKYVDLMIFAGFIFAIGATDVMPWERLERFLRFIQFPWRLFIMTSALFAVSDAIILMLFAKKHLSGNFVPVMAAATGVLIALSLDHQSANSQGYYDYANDYYSYAPYTANVIGGEWLPDTVTDREMLVALSEYMTDSAGNYIDFTRERAIINAKVPSADYVTVPFIYYKGYRAVLTDENGSIHDLKVTGEGTDGMCRVYTEGLTGDLKVYYAGTTLIHLSAAVSLITVILLIGACIMNTKKRKSIAGLAAGAKGIVIFMIMCLPLGLLTGCSSADLEKGAKQLEELNEALKSAETDEAEEEEPDFKDPDNVVDYLKEKDQQEPEEEEPEEETDYTTCNISLEGYDEEGPEYAVMVDTEGADPVYSLVSLEEAKAEGLGPVTVTDMYSKLADEYIAQLTVYYDNLNDPSGDLPLNTEELKTALMQQADILLYLEYYPEGSKAADLKVLAGKLGYLIYESADLDGSDIVLDYNCAAVLSASASLLEDFECAKDASDLALRLWNDAEGLNTDDDQAEINRAWAAASLFKATGNKTYRTIVEAVSGDVELTGVSYDDPGYYCVFAYLSATSSTSYDISGRMMNHFLTDVNARVKSDRQELLDAATSKDNLTAEGLTSEYINGLTDECTIAMMANYISMSVEYTGYAKDRIIFLCGANPTGLDYFAQENLNLYDPVLFALCALSK